MSAFRLVFPLLLLNAGQASAEPRKEAPAESPMIEVPAGTLLSVELVDPVNTGKNKTGEPFRARVLEGVWAKGAVAVPPGATVRGLLSRVSASGRVKGRSQLEMTLRSVDIDGRTYAVHSDTLAYIGDPHTGSSIGSWLGGALQGAVYGVLFGGGKGAVIGAGAGAGAGGISSIIKGKHEVEFAQGARLLFELSTPMRLPALPAAVLAEQKPPAVSSPTAKPAG
jgi:hypothetical protein